MEGNFVQPKITLEFLVMLVHRHLLMENQTNFFTASFQLILVLAVSIMPVAWGSQDRKTNNYRAASS